MKFNDLRNTGGKTKILSHSFLNSECINLLILAHMIKKKYVFTTKKKEKEKGKVKSWERMTHLNKIALQFM